MLIILEGCDGVGKTTLADRLLETHVGSSQIMHKGPIKRFPLEEYEWDLRSYDRTKLGHLLVCDRWHVGELVYGPLYRGRSQVTHTMQRHIEMFLESRGAVRMVVDALPATILRRLRDRGEDLLEEGHIGLVYDFYREYAGQNAWDIVKSHDDVEPILERAHTAQEEVFQLSILKSYIGPTRPDVLIAVDHHPSLPGGPGLLATLPPVPGSMGAWVMSTLMRNEVKSFGFINTQVDDNLEVAMNILRYPKLVTLGSYSKSLAKKLDTALHLPHPRDMFVTPSGARWEDYGRRVADACS